MKHLVVILLCITTTLAKAQYTSIICGPNISPAVNFIYLGTLNFTEADQGNGQKLQIDIIGGDWGNSNKGTTTFYIANRGKLSINQMTLGGSAPGAQSLRIYQNGNTTNFYLAVNSSTAYYSLAVKAFTFGHNMTASSIPITTSTTSPLGNDITSSVSVNPLLITDGNNNISINTSSDPAYKLSVNGSVRAKEVRVETNWADYVFDENYNLRSLKEVATYIKENNHLPDVPSAKDVEENGIKVGETNALLLRKIEELTLYLIEKDKQIDDLNQKLKDILNLQTHELIHPSDFQKSSPKRMLY
ncbi:hypothetical protein [Arcticibacter sp.]|uniref:hypothetical protein n=1 Tax=Arcticibacter sp. TaxID=1872630 RepID=UPI00388F4B3F